jgi:dolichyl-phosphate-mannose-protein mannosyltransferase
VNRRDHLLCAIAGLGVCLAAGTELLSAFHAITRPVLLAFWMLAGGGLAAWFWLGRPRVTPAGTAPGAWAVFREADLLSKATAVVTYVWLTVTGVSAFLAPPSNWDSMTYHLARVAHWYQDRSIAFFATDMASQNQMPPFAEWCMLHILVLTGNDALCNFVQWLSYAGCIWLGSLLAEELGVNARGTVFAGFFVATMPLTVLESTSTQTDLVMTFWLACAIYGCIRLWRELTNAALFIFAASLGLALLTKSVAAIYAPPLGVWFLVAVLRRGMGVALPGIILVAVMVAGLNAGHAIRNFQTSGSPFGPNRNPVTGLHFYTNDIHTPGAIFSNVTRNVNLHLTPFGNEHVVKSMVMRIDRVLGIDPLDPRTTFEPAWGYRILVDYEDGAAMQTHFLFIVLAMGTLAFFSRSREALPWAVAGAVLASGLILCIVLKWQPWFSRMHLPAFVWSTPLVALMVQRSAWRCFLPVAALMMMLATVGDIFHNSVRPALGGHHALFEPGTHTVRFMEQPEMEAPMGTIQRLLQMNGVKDVGLITGFDDWEYPYFDEHDLSRWRVDHVLVKGIYAPLESTTVPDVVIATVPGLEPTLMVHGRRFSLAETLHPAGKNPSIGIYFPDGAAHVWPAGS